MNLPIESLLSAKTMLAAAEKAELHRDYRQAYMDACEAVLFIEAWMRDMREKLRDSEP